MATSATHQTIQEQFEYEQGLVIGYSRPYDDSKGSPIGLSVSTEATPADERRKPPLSLQTAPLTKSACG